MTDRPQTPDEKAVRMYNKPAWLSKWLIRRSRNETTDDRVIDRPRTASEKGQRTNLNPSLLTKLFGRRRGKDRKKSDEE